jgi:hypothetical protein
MTIYSLSLLLHLKISYFEIKKLRPLLCEVVQISFLFSMPQTASLKAGTMGYSGVLAWLLKSTRILNMSTIQVDSNVCTLYQLKLRARIGWNDTSLLETLLPTAPNL